MIIDWATHVPHALSISNPDPFLNDTPSQAEIRAELRASLTTKRNLVLVCRAWRDLALPFLYRCIYVKPDNSIKLYCLLSQDGLSLGRYGRWTRRVDYERPDGDVPLMNLFSLFHLRQFPNLEIVVSRHSTESDKIRKSSGDDPEFAFVLLSACWRTLKVLDCNHSIFLTTPCKLERQGLLCDRSWQKKRFKLGQAGPEVGKVQLCRLRGFVAGRSVDCYAPGLVYVPLPFFLGDHNNSSDLISPIRAMSDVYLGSTSRTYERLVKPLRESITTLEVDFSDAYRLSSKGECARRLWSTLSTYPSLKTLIINNIPLSTFFTYRTTCHGSRVTNIGFRLHTHTSSERNDDPLGYFLEDVRNIPIGEGLDRGLKVIRFFDVDFVKDLNKDSSGFTARRYTTMLKKNGILIQDRHGLVLGS